MDTNTQVDYKVRLSYILSAFRDFFSNSNETESKELEAQIKEIENQQDSSYIETLEKYTNIATSSRKSRTKKTNIKVNPNVGKTKLKKNDKITEIEEKEL